MATKMVIPLCLIGLLFSCVADRTDSDFTKLYVNDDPAKGRFELVIQNLTNEMLCLSPAFWPNASGNIPLTSANISVSAGGTEYPLDTDIADFGSEISRISPHGRAIAYLNYSAFKLPAAARQLPKDLHLTPRSVVCW
jgi:hypothetical protein